MEIESLRMGNHLMTPCRIRKNDWRPVFATVLPPENVDQNVLFQMLIIICCTCFHTFDLRLDDKKKQIWVRMWLDLMSKSTPTVHLG